MTSVVPCEIRLTGRDTVGNFKRTMTTFHTASSGPAITGTDEVTGRFMDHPPLLSSGKRLPPRAILGIDAKADVAATIDVANSCFHIPITLFPVNGGTPIYQMLYKGDADMDYLNFSNTAVNIDTYVEIAGTRVPFGYELDVGYVIDGVDIWARGQGNNGARVFMYLATS